MRSIGRWGAIAAALALTLAFVACGGDDEGSDTTGGSTATTGSTGSTASTGSGGSLAVTIQGNLFDPGQLDVSAGTVTVTVTNEDAITHTFTTDDMSVNEEVGAGETVEVTVDVSEDLGWHCEIHPSMRGKFVVT